MYNNKDLSRKTKAKDLAFSSLWNSLHALLIVSLVLGLRLSAQDLLCSQDICSRSAVRASDILTGVFRAL